MYVNKRGHESFEVLNFQIDEVVTKIKVPRKKVEELPRIAEMEILLIVPTL